MITITYDEAAWKLVPLEPTEEMEQAARYFAHGITSGVTRLLIQTVIRSAPEAPAQPVPDSRQHSVESDRQTDLSVKVEQLPVALPALAAGERGMFEAYGEQCSAPSSSRTATATIGIL